MDLGIAETAAEQQPAFKNAYDLILQALKASRNLSAELSPPVLFQHGLSEAFKWLARWMKKTHALEVYIHVDEGGYPVEEAVKVLLFQSVRELLFNVKKHAHTSCARVAMSRMDGRIKLVVSDTGTGFDTQTAWQVDAETDKGFGLFSVRERLVLLQGTFDIESSPGCGTTVALTAPMNPGGADDECGRWPNRRHAAAGDVYVR